MVWKPHLCLWYGGELSIKFQGSLTPHCLDSFVKEHHCLQHGTPTLNQIPDDMRWSLCNNNRNKVHNKCMCLNYSESTPHPHPSPWKNCIPWNWSLVPKRLGTATLHSSLWIQSRDCGLLQGHDLVCASLLLQTLTHLRPPGYHCQVNAQIHGL